MRVVLIIVCWSSRRPGIRFCLSICLQDTHARVWCSSFLCSFLYWDGIWAVIYRLEEKKNRRVKRIVWICACRLAAVYRFLLRLDSRCWWGTVFVWFWPLLLSTPIWTFRGTCSGHSLVRLSAQSYRTKERKLGWTHVAHSLLRVQMIRPTLPASGNKLSKTRENKLLISLRLIIHGNHVNWDHN